MPNYNRPDPTLPAWCDTGEAVQPQNSDISTGWPSSQVPPSRQEFNWLDKQQDAAIRYLCRVGIAEYHHGESYQGFGLVIGSNRSVYWNLQPCSGVDPVFDNTGKWELTPIRISDADARYLTKAGASSMYLTQAQGDARYQLQANMSAFVTYVAGDGRYAMKADLQNYVSNAAGDARYAFKSDLGNYESIAHAAATYLKIVDAANTYLSKSAAAQMYLSIADANSRFAATTADAHSYTDQQVNNGIANLQAWVGGTIPGVLIRIESTGSGTCTGTFFILQFGAVGANQAWGGHAFELALGLGSCQEGDRVALPNGFSDGGGFFTGGITSAYGRSTTGDALLNLVFTFGPPGWTVQQCNFTKSNDGNKPHGRGLAFGQWWGFCWRWI